MAVSWRVCMCLHACVWLPLADSRGTWEWQLLIGTPVPMAPPQDKRLTACIALALSLSPGHSPVSSYRCQTVLDLFCFYTWQHSTSCYSRTPHPHPHYWRYWRIHSMYCYFFSCIIWHKKTSFDLLLFVVYLLLSPQPRSRVMTICIALTEMSVHCIFSVRCFCLTVIF